MASDHPRGTRRKRRSSGGLENSSQNVASSQNSAQPNVPQRKRAKRVSFTDSQQLQAELEQSENQSNETTANQQPNDTNEIKDSIDVVPDNHKDSKQVRLSDPGLSIRIEQPLTPPDTVSPDTLLTPNMNIDIAGLTPYVQRTSLSPRPQSSHSQGSRSTHSPVLRPNSDGKVVAELQFSPLRQVLDRRVRRRLRRSHLSEEANEIEEHEKEDAKTRQELEELKNQMQEKNQRMKELELELQSQRQRGIDISEASEEEQRKSREMQEELDRLREEIEEHKQFSGTVTPVYIDNGYNIAGAEAIVETIVEEDELTLVEPGDIGIIAPDLNQAAATSFEKEPTPVIFPDPTSEAEVKRFEQVITSLNHELAVVKAALQILTTELQTLGFAEMEAGTDIIIANMRSAFRDARFQLNDMMPQAEANEFENGEFLRLLVDNIRTLLTNVSDQTQTIRSAKELEIVLKQQHSGLLDKLAESKERVQILEKQWEKMDHRTDRQGQKIVELEEDVFKWQENCDHRDQIIDDNKHKIAGLEEDVEMRDRDNEKLQHAINSYRVDLVQAEEVLHTLQEKYNEDTKRMQKDHAKQIHGLEWQVGEQSNHRAKAEKDAEDNAARIQELETQIDVANDEITNLKAQLAESQMDAATQRSQREMAEGEIDEKTSFITAVELQLESVEQQMDDLQAELEQVRGRAESERRQREAAEAELDDRNADVEILHNRLKEAGKEANELRGKLFEAQQRREKEVADLEAKAAERENNLNETLDDERDARARAERRIEELEDVIADLEAKVKNTEHAMDELLAEKDELLTNREGRVNELEGLLKEHENQHQRFAEKKGKEIQALQDKLSSTKEKLEDRSKKMKDMEATAIQKAKDYKDAMEAKDDAINVLNDDLSRKKEEIMTLERIKQSLEQRIEDEAAAMLEAENEHSDTVALLNASLNARDVEIGKLLMEQQAAESRYTEVMQEKDEKIVGLERLADSRLDEVNCLNDQVHDLKEKLTDSVRKGRATTERMNKRIAAALAESQEDEFKLIEDGDQLMANIEDPVESTIAMLDGAADTHGVNDTVPTRKSGRVTQKVKTVKKRAMSTRRRRNHDSGIGVDDDSYEEEMGEMAVA